MPITMAVPKETLAGELRAALVPDQIKRFVAMGLDIVIEPSMAQTLGLPDELYTKESVKLVQQPDLFRNAQIIVRLNAPTLEEVANYEPNSLLIGMLAPHKNDEVIQALKEKNITSFSLELIPRISRAQSMDVLSSQASAAGYQATLIAADLSKKFFPMLTTAAGTIRPAKVLIIGAGVAGLQAIATAKRLGAIVEAYDVRQATKEQVESLGAKFVDIPVTAEGQGGYARELTEEEKAQQQAALAKTVSKSDVVITTAAIPGRPSPKILTRAMVDGMPPGAVIVDMAAEGGGNCELTQPGETIVYNGITIAGPLQLPSRLALHASEMYCKNVYNFLNLLVKDGALNIDLEDAILKDSLLTHQGKITHGPTAARLNTSHQGV
jgi:NAD(P) transhydrogenase subunit alpha